MESLLVHGNGESAVVLVIDSYHSSLQKRNAAKAIQTEGHVIPCSLFLYVPLPHSLTHTRREEKGWERMGGVREIKRKKGRGEQGRKGGKKKREKEEGDGN